MPGIETLALIVSSIATSTLAANALYLGTMALAYAGLAYGASMLQGLFVKKPDVPRPEDGSYNLKQSVPPLSYALGRVKKGGDYLFLEEAGGTAYHITCLAAHPVKGILQHYLHDEKVTLDTNGDVIEPTHFVIGSTRYVNLQTRLGSAIGTAYAQVTAAFATIWSADHRGDGLATVLMRVQTADNRNYMSVFPNQMPQHSAAIEGHSQIYDPRTDALDYSENIALFRLWHLTHPVGGKLLLEDMYLPEWAAAASVCDEVVTNRDDDEEPRYHGGLWFRANNDPIEVGRNLDQAGELVVYERPDGLIGVHPGKFVTPDIRLTAKDILSIQLDGNTRDASNVLAVRGRYVDLAQDFNTADAAIYGDPYTDETERTKTVDNICIQSHNHVQRLQKITYIRANAPRVSVTAHYEAAKNVPYRRFVKVHYPPKMTEVTVEITSSPKLSLRNLTMEFSGIIVPDSLYDFNAALEEGAPGASAEILPPSSVPAPTGFTAVIGTEVVSGGSRAAFAVASWSFVNASLVYEFEWERVSVSEPPRSTLSTAGETSVRTDYLADGVNYRFRLRTWGNGTPSAWTDYETLTTTADPTPPGVVTGAAAIGDTGSASYVWTAPNSANYAAARIYINTVDSFSGSTLLATEYGAPNAPDGKTFTGLSAGDYFGFIVAVNASGVAAAPVATGEFTVL